MTGSVNDVKRALKTILCNGDVFCFLCSRKLTEYYVD
jgi:hypothetical protein